jgi:hypothetical protein
LIGYGADGELVVEVAVAPRSDKSCFGATKLRNVNRSPIFQPRQLLGEYPVSILFGRSFDSNYFPVQK